MEGTIKPLFSPAFHFSPYLSLILEVSHETRFQEPAAGNLFISFIQQIFIEYLLCASDHLGAWDTSVTNSHLQRYSGGTYILAEAVNCS